jgi:hypothetical protein
LRNILFHNKREKKDYTVVSHPSKSSPPNKQNKPTNNTMKLSLVIAAMTAASGTAFDSTTGKYGAVDTTRAPRFFDPPKARKPGYSYADEVKIAVAAEMDTMGLALKGTFDATGDMVSEK